MKTILCYGDSNTWGWDPAGGIRHPRFARWPGVLQQTLGDDTYVIEEGLNGRTTVWDDPIEGPKNGKTYLAPCLESHAPLDLVVMMLGTNDLKKRFSVSPFDIAEGAAVLVRIIIASAAGPDSDTPKILLLSPPPVGAVPELWTGMFEGAAEKAPHLAAQYRRVAEEHGCHFLDTSAFIAVSPLDGIHLEASEHRKLGERVAEKIQEILETE